MSFKKILSLSVCSAALIGLIAPASSWAQSRNNSTKLPDISVPPIEANVNRENELNAENFTEYKIQNKYLADKITLQYQIALIENLITWQKQVGEIQNAYSSIGVSYTTPQPPQGLCEQVPANVPCFNAFPDLYPDTEVELEERLKEIDEQKQEAAVQEQDILDLQRSLRPELNPNGNVSSQTPSMNVNDVVEKAAAAKLAAEKAAGTVYEWVEIFCLSGACEAVIGSRNDPEFRRTVKVSETLPDGSTVTKIQPNRMEVSIAGKVIPLKPAPLTRDSTAPVAREIPDTLDALEQQFSAFPGSVTSSTNQPRSTTSLDSVAPVPLTDTTGLDDAGLIPR